MKKQCYLWVSFILFFSLVAWATPVGEGLVAYYSGDNGAQDESGQANNGSLNGGVGFVSGVEGNAFDFDGTNDFVRVNDSSSLDFSNAISMSAFINPHTPGAGDGTMAIVWKGNISSPTDQSYGFLWTSDRRVFFRINAGGLRQVATPVLDLNQFHHVTGVYDGSQIQMFLNGVLVSSTSVTGTITNTSHSLFLGASSLDSVNPFALFDGAVDDVALYNRALSLEDVRFNAGLVPEINSALFFFLTFVCFFSQRKKFLS